MINPLLNSSAPGDEGGEKELRIGEGGLLDCTCFEKEIHWYFCSVCGVRLKWW
jgi:hypothetical protein